MFSIVSIIVSIMPVLGCSPSSDGGQSRDITPTPIVKKYQNPIIPVSLPDPSIVKSPDGVPSMDRRRWNTTPSSV